MGRSECKVFLITGTAAETGDFDSVCLGTKRAVAAMRKAGEHEKPRGGSTINLVSAIGLFGAPMSAAYGAARGGIPMSYKSVAIEGARETIRVKTAHSGLISTNVQQEVANSAEYDDVFGHSPLSHTGDPLDVANTNLFLAFDESRYVTGAEFVVDGGMTAS